MSIDWIIVDDLIGDPPTEEQRKLMMEFAEKVGLLDSSVFIGTYHNLDEEVESDV